MTTLGTLNEKERSVWLAVWKASEQGTCYAPLSDIRPLLPPEMSKRAFSGYMAQLAKKGYLFSFGSGTDLPKDLHDVEVSCDAVRHEGGTRRQSYNRCNIQTCSCHDREK